MKKEILVLIGLIGFAVAISAQGTGIPSQLRVKTDSTGALVVAGAVQVPPFTTTTFNNTRLKTDSEGNLLVTTSTIPLSFPLLAPEGGCDDPPYSFNDAPTVGFSLVQGAAVICHSENSIFAVTPAGVFTTVGFQYLTDDGRPACNAGNRGMTWYTPGGEGVADAFDICVKDAGDSFAWTNLLNP